MVYSLRRNARTNRGSLKAQISEDRRTRIMAVGASWKAQRWDGSKGTKVLDPWQDIGGLTSKDAALRQAGMFPSGDKIMGSRR